MWGEVRFKVSWEDQCVLGKDMESDGVEFDREVVGEARSVAEGGTKATAGIDDGAIGPEEEDEGCVDVAEGWWIGCRRWGYVAYGCHDGVGGLEGFASVALEEDIFFPKESEGVIGDGG